MVMVVQLGEELFRNLKDKNSFFTFYLDSVQNSIPPKCDYSLINAQMAKIVQGCQTLENERCKNKVSPYRIRAEIYTLVADLVDYVEHDIDFKKDGSVQKQIFYLYNFDFRCKLHSAWRKQRTQNLLCPQRTRQCRFDGNFDPLLHPPKNDRKPPLPTDCKSAWKVEVNDDWLCHRNLRTFDYDPYTGIFPNRSNRTYLSWHWRNSTQRRIVRNRYGLPCIL